MLDPEQVNEYREKGYFVGRSVIDQDLIARVKDVVSDLVHEAEGLATHNEKFDLDPAHKPNDPRVRRIKTPHLWDPIFLELLKSPSLIACLRSLLGSNIRLHGSKLNMKSAGDGAAVEWHQDWAFYPHSNDDVLAVGVMLDDVTTDNGPMLVIPGSHKVEKVWDHHHEGRFCGAIAPKSVTDINFDKAVACTGKAGDCTFHHVRLVHGSATNFSHTQRNLMLYECASADAWPYFRFSDLEEFNSRMILGEPTVVPRSASVPIRMPFPPSKHQGSIYENQTVLADRFFGDSE